jgi:EAL domain-containing protein (putative c-di-GMP-specific phosphodiesterase class I)
VHNEIIKGLERGEFYVLYQPFLTNDGARIAGVEALLRWNRPGLKTGPGEFIKVAEQTGAIHELGLFVLRQACRDALQWPALSVAVNISAPQLLDPLFVKTVQTIVQESGLPFARLELEIVESAFIEDFEIAEQAISRLRKLGIRIALDDFGTGYSSLTYLRRLPLDKIKIDQSFVAGVDTVGSAAIVQAVVALGRALGLKITAEGVETQDQYRFLRACGVQYMQGYLFSCPVAAAAISECLPLERRGLLRQDRVP